MPTEPNKIAAGNTSGPVAVKAQGREESPEPPPGQRARELALELARVRAAAEAASLRARAAEIELMLQRLMRAPPSHPPHEPPVEPKVEPPVAPQVAPSIEAAVAAPVTPDEETSPPLSEPASRMPQLAITSWSELTDAAKRPDVASTANPARLSEVGPSAGKGGAASIKSGERKRTGNRKSPPSPVLEPPEGEDAPRRRRRPAAIVVSALAHAVLVVLLAATTLTVPSPGDAITLAAAPPQPVDEPVQTVQMQQVQPAEPTVAEAPEAAATEVTVPMDVDVPSPAAVTPASIAPSVASAMAAADLLATSAASAAVPGEAATHFFGTQGGGNHFVYLVDNSRSMDDVARDGFEVARREVLRAVDSLGPDQRFYVIFFGRETHRMRLSDPSAPEPHSVRATDENKRALRRWAAAIQMQEGRWPEEALGFAFELRPDCIFLLTDGAMPDYVGEMIRRHNIVDTLLDGPKPRSIIHTVGFHNSEGAAQLRAIAEDNGGMYRFVPAMRAGGNR